MKDFSVEIENVIKQIIDNYHPQKIILFGSCALEKNTNDSDIDLLIIKETEKRPIERIHEVHNPLEYNIPLDILVYTPKEVEIFSNDHKSFINKILKEGKILYEQAV